ARPSSSSAVSSAPFSQTCPDVGSSSPASSASSVDLPAPDGPTMAAVEPRATSNVTLSRMVSSPSGLLTFFVSCSARNTKSPVLMRKRLTVLVTLATLFVAASGSAGQTIVVVGDSLSSGYGLAAEQSWVSMLRERLNAEAYGYDVVNASI